MNFRFRPGGATEIVCVCISPVTNGTVNTDSLTNRGNDLMISISGIRGVIPTGLDPTNIAAFASAFAKICGKKTVIGQDGRATAPLLSGILKGTLLGAGIDVIDLGVVPTPTVKANVTLLGVDSGVVITASHNPPQWNGFKFIGNDGLFFDKTKMDRWRKELDSAYSGSYTKIGQESTKNGIKRHVESILAIIPNLKKIKKAKFKVLVDAVGASGRDAMPYLLEKLDCKAEKMFCSPMKGGEFPRPPEPTPSALERFSQKMRVGKFAVGFALDPDADRLVLGSKKVGAIHEEYTLPLAFLGLLKTQMNEIKNHPVVVNLSTSNALPILAKSNGIEVYRSAVGEANVVEKMINTGALYGGEGNGGVIHLDVPSAGRDSLTGAALVLCAMAEAEVSSIDDLLIQMPQLYMEKLKIERGNLQLEDIYFRIKGAFADATENTVDGLRLDFSTQSWVHVRPSNTEPIVRVIAEASSEDELKAILVKCRQAVQNE